MIPDYNNFKVDADEVKAPAQAAPEMEKNMFKHDESKETPEQDAQAHSGDMEFLRDFVLALKPEEKEYLRKILSGESTEEVKDEDISNKLNKFEEELKPEE